MIFSTLIECMMKKYDVMADDMADTLMGTIGCSDEFSCAEKNGAPH